jgi:hypothetical protein
LKFFTSGLGDAFFLSGGTALSVFYAEHRQSKDLDFFLKKKLNLTRYTNFFKQLAPVHLTIAESDDFCSYIYPEDIKVDYVYDNFSIEEGEEKEKIRLDGIIVNVDTLKNIAINKICASVSRNDPKDIVDLTWLFSNSYSASKDFLKLFRIAQKREGLLDDLFYVKEVFVNTCNNADKIISSLSGSLIKNFTTDDIITVFSSFDKLIENLLLSNDCPDNLAEPPPPIKL